MSCYLIRVENGHKVARSITSQEEYKLIRGSYEQKANLRLAREGNDGAKRRLVQFNYSGHYPQGVVKGMKLPSRAFGFDLDDKQDFEKAVKLMLQEPEKYGLLMLERSARQGGHAVCKREMGKTHGADQRVKPASIFLCMLLSWPDKTVKPINAARETAMGSRSPAGPRRLGTATRMSVSLSRRLSALFGSTPDQDPKAAKPF